MKTKILLLCSVLLISLTSATNAQSNEWEIYNTANSPLANNSVLAVETVGNSAWLGTTAGLNYFNGTSWTTLTTENSGLPNNQINDIAREENGTLWFATENGLAKLYDHQWTVFNSSNSALPVNIIKCITIDEAGNKWIGTWGGGIAKFDNSNFTVYTTANSQIPANGIYCISINNNDAVWVGTFSSGLAVLESNNWTTYNTSNSTLPSNEVKSIAFDKDDNTWIGTGSGIVKIEGNNWTTINSSVTGFPFQSVNAINCTKNVLFATNNGVIEFDGVHWISYRVDNSSLPANDVRAIDVDDNMNVWMATAGGGIAIYNSEGVALSVENANTSATTLNVFPNPANGEVTLSFSSSEAGNTEVSLFDVQGRKVCTVLNETVAAGKHEVIYNTNTLPSGAYIWFVRFKDRTDFVRLLVQ